MSALLPPHLQLGEPWPTSKEILLQPGTFERLITIGVLPQLSQRVVSPLRFCRSAEFIACPNSTT
jgi:hypothetical protein